MLVYDSLEQARMRLGNSTITVDDKAFYVHDVSQARGGKIKLNGTFYPLRPFTDEGNVPGKAYAFDIDDPKLNFRRFRVGYINVPAPLINGKGAEGGYATFLTRDTVRQQIQGLTRRSMVTGQGQNPGEYLFFSQDFEDMLFDRYPSLSDAMAMMDKGWTSVAISRLFAIGTDKKYPGLTVLSYRDRTVGLAIGRKFPHFVIDTTNEYLKEALAEAGFPFKVEEK